MPTHANPSPWRRVYPAEYDRRGVPQPLRHAVKVLNESLEINRLITTQLLETFRTVDSDTEAKIEAHPTLVLGGEASVPGSRFSVLGLINGLVMTERFRIAGWFDDDQMYKDFYVLENTHAPRPELLVPAEEAILHGKKQLEAAHEEVGALTSVILAAWRDQSIGPIADIIVMEDQFPAIDIRKALPTIVHHESEHPTAVDITVEINDTAKD